MSDLKSRYQQILKELQDNIKNEKERNFVITKFQELSIIFMDIIDRLTYVTDIRVKDIEEKQKEMENKIGTVQKIVDGIENDIYEEEEPYEFEIVCPYCNHEFLADINSDMVAEIECPECHNVIELDWNSDESEEEYEHNCPNCNRECIKNQALTYDADSEEDLEEDKKHQNINKEKNDEDEENEPEDEDEDM